MKKAKNILASILAILMVISMLPITTSAANSCGENATWGYNASTYTLTISGTGDMNDYGYSNRPWESYEDKIKTVIIEDGITSIGAYAFYSFGKVTSITIPDTVTKIGRTAFNACSVLTSIVLPEGITSIPDRAFTNCKALTSVNIPSTVTSIGTSAFEGCKALTSVTLPDGLTSIGDSAFASCIGLTSVTLPAGLTTIGNLAFSGCTGLTGIFVDEDNATFSSDEYGVLFNKDKTTLVSYPASNTATSYEIPDTVTTIAAYAFNNSTSLTSVVIPNSVNTISTYAFNGCTGLASVTIPDTVTTIEDYAFYGCSALESITFGSGIKEIKQYAFSECDSLVSVSIPAGVNVDKKAFINSDKLANITLSAGCSVWADTFSGTAFYNNAENWENGLLYIGDYLIAADTTLAGDVQIKEGTKKFAVQAFYGCTSITSLVIPEGVEVIDNEAFAYCSKLKTITIPESVKTIKDSAFVGCNAIEKVFYPKDYDTWYSIELGSYNEPLKNSSIYSSVTGEEISPYPAGQYSDLIYDKDTQTLTIYGKFVMTDYGTGQIGSTNTELTPWHNYRSDIKKVIIKKGITAIGEYAFYRCTNLQAVEIADTVTEIRSNAFKDDTSIKYIIIPNSVKEIHPYAFYDCRTIKNVYFSGTKEEWNKVSISSGNQWLTSANLFFVDENGHTHVYEFGTIVTPPTCTEKGYTTYFCYCGDTYVANYVDAAHKYTSTVVEPTCTEKGYTTYTCDCGDSYVADYVDAAHKYTITVVEQTCTEDGYNIYTCHCGDSYSVKTFNAGHKSISTVVIKEKTCTSPGEEEHVCGRCGETYTKIVYALGHNEVVVPAVAPTVNSTGLTQGSKCSVCGKVFVEQQVVPKLNTCGDNVRFSYTSGCLTIYGTGPMYDFKSNNRPWEDYEDKIKTVVVEEGVTTIGANAFYSCDYLTSVTLPNGLTSIGNYAFDDADLKSITIPDTVNTIGSSAFYYCTNLKSVNIPYGVTTINESTFASCYKLSNITIPDSVTTIKDSAFGGCDGITEIVIPDSVTTIGDGAFEYCDGLTSVTIGSGVTTIGKWAFGRCSKLTSITIPKNVTTIGESPFFDCQSFTNIIVDKDNQHYINDEYGVLYNKDKTLLVQYPIGNTRTNYAISEGVTTIGAWAFENCVSLTSITLPDSLRIIERCAFSGCNGVTSLVIPDGVTTIGQSAIRDCDNLTSVTIPDTVTTIDGYAITSYKIIINYGGTANQWKQLMANNKDAETYYLIDNMVYCSDETILPSGECGDNLTWTFNVATGTLTFSGTGDMYHFDYFSKFDRAENPWWTYRSSIKNVVIGDGVTRIGGYAFYRCDNLKMIYYGGTQSQWSKVSFGSHNDPLINAGIHYNSTETHQPDYTLVVTAPTCTEQGYTTYNCYCGGHYVDNYVYKLGHTDNDNNEYCDICSAYIYVATGTCGNNLTWGFNESTDTLIISGIGSMSDYYSSAPNTPPWKSYQYKIKKIIINDGVTQIGDYAFNSCTNLISVTIPYSVTWVNWNAFNYCTSLTDVYYCGTEVQWNSVAILSYNDPLLNANIHYNSTGPHTHDYEADATTPNCTEQGYTTYTCECGDTYIADYVDELGHAEEIIPAVAPTTSTTGLTEGKKCSVCGVILVEQEIVPVVEITDIVLVPENEDVLPEGTEIDVSILESTDNSIIFNISLENNGTEVQPNGNVTVKIPVPADMDGTKLSVYRAEDDGTYTNMNAAFENGYMVFTTDHFSIYIMAYEEPTAPSEPECTHATTTVINVVAPTCTTAGYNGDVLCTICEEIIESLGEAPTTGHTDNDGDGYCDADNELLDPTVECDHNCHKGGISGFFWKIANFFNKIFRIKQYCECGAAHW